MIPYPPSCRIFPPNRHRCSRGICSEVGTSLDGPFSTEGFPRLIIALSLNRKFTHGPRLDLCLTGYATQKQVCYVPFGATTTNTFRPSWSLLRSVSIPAGLGILPSGS